MTAKQNGTVAKVNPKRGKRPTTTRLRTESTKIQKLLSGELTVQDMDDEELVRMQFKDKNGRFTGRPPAVIPGDVARAAQTELLKRGRQMFEESFLKAIERMAHLAANAEDETVQLKAAQYIVERIAGKTPDKVDITVDAPWQVVLTVILVPDEEGPAAAKRIVQGEVTSRA